MVLISLKLIYIIESFQNYIKKIFIKRLHIFLMVYFENWLIYINKQSLIFSILCILEQLQKICSIPHSSNNNFSKKMLNLFRLFIWQLFVKNSIKFYFYKDIINYNWSKIGKICYNFLELICISLKIWIKLSFFQDLEQKSHTGLQVNAL